MALENSCKLSNSLRQCLIDSMLHLIGPLHNTADCELTVTETDSSLDDEACEWWEGIISGRAGSVAVSVYNVDGVCKCATRVRNMTFEREFPVQTELVHSLPASMLHPREPLILYQLPSLDWLVVDNVDGDEQRALFVNFQRSNDTGCVHNVVVRPHILAKPVFAKTDKVLNHPLAGVVNDIVATLLTTEFGYGSDARPAREEGPDDATELYLDMRSKNVAMFKNVTIIDSGEKLFMSFDIPCMDRFSIVCRRLSVGVYEMTVGRGISGWMPPFNFTVEEQTTKLDIPECPRLCPEFSLTSPNRVDVSAIDDDDTAYKVSFEHRDVSLEVHRKNYTAMVLDTDAPRVLSLFGSTYSVENELVVMFFYSPDE